MNRSYLDNLPPLTKQEAFDIIKKPINELRLASDYYMAIFHLSKYPCFETEELLLSLISSDSTEQPIQIAKRKAIEVLGRMDCKRAIPFIASHLNSTDPYLVENAAWALQELGCKDRKIIKLISSLLNDNRQNQRLLIQVLSKMEATSELPNVQELMHQPNISPGIKGACIAAIAKLSGDSSQIKVLEGYLLLPNQNDRQSAVEDIIASKGINTLSKVLTTPISPFFKFRAISSLCVVLEEKEIILKIFSYIETVLEDDPKRINILGLDFRDKSIEDLVFELFNTDFNRAYYATRLLNEKNIVEVMPNLLNVWGRLKKDYGALYFLTLLFRNIEGLSSYEKDLVIDLLFYCLSDNWPLSIKFRSSAIISLMKINSCLCKNYIDKWLDSDLNPYWPCRYATLISLDNNIDGNNLNIFIESLRNSLNDSNRLVKLKAQEIFSRRFSLGKNFL